MRTVIGALVMIAGASILGSAPAHFDLFAYHHFPGNIVAGALLFLIGISLWLRGLLAD